MTVPLPSGYSAVSAVHFGTLLIGRRVLTADSSLSATRISLKPDGHALSCSHGNCVTSRAGARSAPLVAPEALAGNLWLLWFTCCINQVPATRPRQARPAGLCVGDVAAAGTAWSDCSSSLLPGSPSDVVNLERSRGARTASTLQLVALEYEAPAQPAPCARRHPPRRISMRRDSSLPAPVSTAARRPSRACSSAGVHTISERQWYPSTTGRAAELGTAPHTTAAVPGCTDMHAQAPVSASAAPGWCRSATGGASGGAGAANRQPTPRPPTPQNHATK